MTTGISEILDRIEHAGIALRLDGPDIYARGSGGALSADLIDLLRVNKPVLLAELTRIRLDFETGSQINLRKQKIGASSYAEHPSTRVLLLSYCIGDGPVQVWREGRAIPRDLQAALARGGPIAAHNATFDQAIWNTHLVPLGWPELPWERWTCTSIRARLVRLPASLAGAGAALELPVQKDKAGAKLMLRLARTAFRGGYEPTEEEFDRLASYCSVDTEVLRELDRLLPEPDPDTRALIDLDHVMNRRGLPVDLDLVRRLIRVRDAENQRLVEAINQLTGGVITRPTQRDRIMQLLHERGVELENLERETLEKWINEHPDADDLPARLIRNRYEFSHSSDAKLQRIVDEAAVSGRVRDGFIFFGAHTGRWSGKGAQPQNFPRAELDNTEATLFRLATAADSDDPARVADDGSKDAKRSVKAQIAGSLRGCFLAPEGEVFVCVDLSQIEARVLAWLADQHDKLALFSAGEDIYPVTARALGSDDRAFGKLVELSSGFGAGARTLLNKAPGFGVKLDPPAAEKAKEDWRAANPDIVRFWYALRDAVDAVVEQPLDLPPVSISRVRIRRTPGAVRIALPSGRDLIYREPRYALDEEYGDQLTLTALQPKGEALLPTKLWYGVLTENVVSGIARDILAAAMLILHREGVRIVATIHDEIVALASEDQAEAILSRMIEVLSTPPVWASDLPLAAEGYVNRRYLKPRRLPAHAPLAPSAASRWMNCPGSVQAEKASPGPPPSPFAEEGTEAHRLFAQCLEQGLKPSQLTDDPAIAFALQFAVTRARHAIDGRPVLLEHRLPPLPDLPQVWGTADCITFDFDRVDGIIDLKFGAGVAVEPNTPQLAVYALLAARHFGLSGAGITATILQPRAAHQDGPIRSHHYTPEDLDRFEEKLRATVVATEQPDAPRVAGEWCRFCNAASSCPEFQRASLRRSPAPSIWRRPVVAAMYAHSPGEAS